MASPGSLNSQKDNKRAAFKRMVTSQRFKDWHKLKTAQLMQKAHSIEIMLNRAVDEAMEPGNIKVEIGARKEDGRIIWVAESPEQSG